MADTMPSSSERTSLEARFAGVPAPALPPRECPEEPLAADALARAREFGTELAGALRDSAAALLDEQKIRAANEITGLGEVLNRSVQSLDRRGRENVAGYAAAAARHIRQFADRLQRRPLGELTGDMEDFARRLPFAFVVSAIGVGLIAGRVLVSSASRLAEQDPAERDPVRTADGGPVLAGAPSRGEGTRYVEG